MYRDYRALGHNQDYASVMYTRLHIFQKPPKNCNTNITWKALRQYQEENIISTEHVVGYRPNTMCTLFTTQRKSPWGNGPLLFKSGHCLRMVSIFIVSKSIEPDQNETIIKLDVPRRINFIRRSQRMQSTNIHNQQVLHEYPTYEYHSWIKTMDSSQ